MATPIDLFLNNSEQLCVLIMFKYLNVCLVTDLLPVFTRNALSHLWFYYVGSIAKETSPDHVMQVFHVNMMSLPWQRLIPELQTIETMVKVCIYFLNYKILKL